jgi:prepilin peptidase CpaA
MRTMSTPLIAILLAVALIAAIIDLRTQKIPNLLTYPAMIFALSYHSTISGFEGLIFSVSGLFIGITLLIIPYVMGGMGAGDAKLLGAIGSFLGAKDTFGAFIFIALAGGIYSLALILIHRNVFKGFFSEKLLILSSMVMLRQYVPIQAESSEQRPRLKYGVAIALGTITYLMTKALGIKFFI